jgi:hypothetical protein
MWILADSDVRRQTSDVGTEKYLKPNQLLDVPLRSLVAKQGGLRWAGRHSPPVSEKRNPNLEPPMSQGLGIQNAGEAVGYLGNDAFATSALGCDNGTEISHGAIKFGIFHQVVVPAHLGQLP